MKSGRSKFLKSGYRFLIIDDSKSESGRSKKTIIIFWKQFIRIEILNKMKISTGLIFSTTMGQSMPQESWRISTSGTVTESAAVDWPVVGWGVVLAATRAISAQKNFILTAIYISSALYTKTVYLKGLDIKKICILETNSDRQWRLRKNFQNSLQDYALYLFRLLWVAHNAPTSLWTFTWF